MVGPNLHFHGSVSGLDLTRNNQVGKLMDNKSIVALGTVTLIVMGLAFYWYEYRPSRIRATCEMQSTEQSTEFLKQMMGKQVPKGFPEGLYSQANKEAYYLSCVREQGLER